MGEERREARLGSRLSACAQYVREGARVADVGTDHAHLAVWLIRSGRASEVIATDINEGPLSLAQRNIEQSGTSDRIKTVLCDGLTGIGQGGADDVVIAGMGGDVIIHILEEAQWLQNEKYRLILQPMRKAERLRAYLCRTGFEIEDETAVRDAGRLYTVICASFKGRSTEPTLMMEYGGALLEKHDELSREYISRAARAMRTKAEGLRHCGEEKAAQELFDAAQQMEGEAQ